jgi:uncharacterized membrane protein YfcA
MDGLYVAAGFLVGGIVGLTGVGGGSLMTPLLVLVFGVSPVTAVGTDLLFAAVTKSGGAWVHARRGGVDWHLVARLAAGSIPASLATLAALHFLQFDHARLAAVMSTALGVALLLTALSLVFRDRLHKMASARFSLFRSEGARTPMIIVGAILGALVTLSSVGAGALGVTALMFLAPGLSAARIVGSDIAHAVPLTLVAGLGHAAAGAVDWTLLGSLLIGSLPGIYLGSMLTRSVPERVLRALLAVMLVMIGGKLVW